MREADRDQYLRQLRAGYRKIVLGYFSKDPNLKPEILMILSTRPFFADIAVSHIVEIHMELMDEFFEAAQVRGT